ncbi:DNA polymerase/3'-5' exonuclease PolX [candidate division GN15 bacterium]|nr:DNA polymerase/3'-5' exonuclease PolX [candidate division GN15 bacterium]
MPVPNSDIVAVLNELANLLSLKGDNPFRIRAYRAAARAVEGLSKPVKAMLDDGDSLTDYSGIGDDLADKIETIAHTGTLPQLKKLRDELPSGLLEMLKLEGLGPRTVQTLHEELQVSTLEQLRRAAEDGRVAELEGFGEKTQQQILDEIDRRDHSEHTDRVRLDVAEESAEPLCEFLADIDGIKQVTVAGSYRRRKETVGDLDVVATARRDSDVMRRFVEYDDVDSVVSQGKTRSTIILRGGLQVDLRVVPQVAYGSALQYFTGSKEHSVELRKIARKKKLKLNEYGLFDKDDERVAGRTETSVYEKLGLTWVPPELREARGEIEAGLKDTLPDLVELDDIRGDLQCHTTASDGKNSLREMAEAARDIGYDYLAITDHSKKVTVANGLDEERLSKLIGRIDKLNEDLDDFQVLKSVEVDILKDGTLDLSDEILGELDIVIASTHYHRKLARKGQTERILKALDNKHVNILAHPTGRMIGERDEIDFDMEQVMDHAKKVGCYLEINTQPERLDLADNYIRMARDKGLKLSIATDAHSTSELGLMRYGVGQARRGWLEKKDVLNTRTWKQLKKLLSR